MKRKWLDWPGRTIAEINSTSGIFALAGAGVAATGVVIAAPVVLGLGGALALGTATWCAWRGYPPAMAHPRDLQGVRIDDLRQLAAVTPMPQRIGFIGASGTGKSTLLAHLQAQSVPESRTEDPYAVIIAIPGQSEAYFAMIDAAGQQYSQQFKVIDEADAVVVFLDHAKGDAANPSNEERLLLHEAFLEQVSGHLRASGKNLSKLHFILNKRDLWQPGPDADNLKQWFNQEVTTWSTGATQTLVSQAYHSNRITDDITSLVNVLRSWAQRGMR